MRRRRGRAAGIVAALGAAVVVLGGWGSLRADAHTASDGGARTAPGNAVEHVESFVSDIVLNKDGSADVAEKIVYDFGTSRRHGINRVIPVRLPYSGPDPATGKKVEKGRWERVFPISRVRVSSTDSGTPVDVEVDDSTDLYRIRIGDEDRTITGVHTYEIRYRIGGVVNGFDDHDEFPWNVTGSLSEVPITAAAVSIAAPGRVSALRCVTGKPPAVTKCASAGVNAAKGIALAAEKGIAPGEDMTVYLSLPTGVLDEPRPLLDEVWSVGRAFEVTPVTVGALVGGSGAALVGVGALVATRGRDRRHRGEGAELAFGGSAGERRATLFDRDVHPVEYVPPEGIRPAQIGVLLDERVDPIDITATIVDLAVRGYLVIEHVPRKGLLGRGDHLIRRGPASTAPPEGEGPGDSERPESDRDSGSAAGAGSGAGSGSGPLVGAGAGSAAGAGSVGGADPGPGQPPAESGAGAPLRPYEKRICDLLLTHEGRPLRSVRRAIGLSIPKVHTAMYADAVGRGWFRKSPEKVRESWKARGVGLGLVGVAVTGVVAWRTHYGLAALGLPLAGAVLAVASRAMPARTPSGSAMVGRITGFRDLFDVGEGDRQVWAEAAGHFPAYLPYAMVFGCTKLWASRLGELVAAGLVEADAVTRSSWYRSERGWDAGSVGQINSLVEGISGSIGAAVQAATATSSGSSGSSSGGSGGGFGGGGVGSW